VLQAIPASQVTVLIYDYEYREPENNLAISLPGAEPCPVCLIPAFIAGWVGNQTSPRLWHVVWIHWENAGESAVAVFHPKGRVIGPFVDQLQGLTGKTFRDRYQERLEQAKAQRDSASDRDFKIQLDRPARIGVRELSAGSYRVSVREIGADVRWVYIQRGTLRSGSKTIAQFAARSFAAPSNRRFEVIYDGPESRVPVIVGLRTAHTEIRFGWTGAGL
jgi:hypothetical protein